MSLEAATEAHAPKRLSREGMAGLLSLPAFGAILMWAGVAPFGKYALETFPTLAYTALRPLFGATLMFAVLLLTGRSLAIERRDWKRFAVAGIGCVGVAQILFTGGLARTSVAHLVILSSTSPLMAALIRRVFRGQTLDRQSLAGLLIGLAGVGIVVADSGSTAGTSVLGDVMALGAGLAWVGATVVPQPLVARYGAPKTTAWLLAGSALAIVPFSLGSIATAFNSPPPTLAWVSLLYTAMGMLVGNALWQRAVQEVGPGRTLVYLYLEPVLAMMLAALFLDERLTLMQAVGGMLALAGVVLVRKE